MKLYMDKKQNLAVVSLLFLVTEYFFKKIMQFFLVFDMIGQGIVT